MACAEWSDLIDRCRERLRNAIFSATIWLKMQHFHSYLYGRMRPTGSHRRECITEGHTLTRCGAHVPYPLPSAARISKSVQSEVLLQFHTRAQTPTSQHIIRMHSLPSPLRNLKQHRRSLCSRYHKLWFCLMNAHFGMFLILTLQQATQWGSNFYGRVLLLSAIMCYNNSLRLCLCHD